MRARARRLSFALPVGTVMDLEDRQIGIRAQDIQTGLQDVDLRGSYSPELVNTRLVGMAERLAIHLRGSELISLDEPEEHSRFVASASFLGIDPLNLPRVIKVLEEVGVVRNVQWQGGDRIARLEESVPYFGSLYELMGEYWREANPTEVETASVALLDRLALPPVSKEDALSDLGLDQRALEGVVTIGQAGGYIKELVAPSTGETLISSPLFWEENPEALFALLQKYSAPDIATAIKSVRMHQGYPVPSVDGPNVKRSDRIIAEAMAHGLLPTPAVTSTRGKKYFAFTPYVGGKILIPVEKVILQKARALLSCVRYGEQYGAITRIRDPKALLEALRDKRMIGPHTEIAMQYHTLAIPPAKVARIERVGSSGKFLLRLIDTEENLKALALACDMLEVGEVITERLVGERHGRLFPQGMQEPLTTLSEIVRRRVPELSDEAFQRDVERLVESTREGAWS